MLSVTVFMTCLHERRSHVFLALHMLVALLPFPSSPCTAFQQLTGYLESLFWPRRFACTTHGGVCKRNWQLLTLTLVLLLSLFLSPFSVHCFSPILGRGRGGPRKLIFYMLPYFIQLEGIYNKPECFSERLVDFTGPYILTWD